MELHQMNKEEILKRFKKTFSSLDLQRTEGLERLKVLQLAQNKSLVREKSRLEEKYGSDHPRLKRFSDQIEYNKRVLKEVEVVIERSKITVPDFDRNTWMVQGQVIDKNSNPVAGLTVSLQDEDKKWVRQLGYTCTDQRGYYVLRYRVEPGQEPAFGKDENFYISVSDQTYELLHRESQPVNVSIGQIDYRQIVLTGKVCSPPKPGDGDTAVVPPEEWVARGVVRYEDNTAGAGLTVSLFDKDLIFDDALGTILTDDAGRFQIIYRADKFRDLFEKQPDLYLKVLDKKGTELYTSKDAIRSEAGQATDFRIVLKQKDPRLEK